MGSKEKRDFYSHVEACSGMLKCYSSRTLCAEPNGKYEVSVHYNELEIYHFLSGDLFFSFEGRRIPVHDGDMIVIANNMLHKPIIQSVCDYQRERIIFKKDIFKQLSASGLELYRVLAKQKILICSREIVEGHRLDRMFSEIQRCCGECTAYGDFCALISLFSFLIKAEQHSMKADQPSLEDQPRQNGKVLAIAKYIDENLSEDLSYRVIAQKFFLSEKNLYKLFKKETGFTLSDYINERRIIMAQSLMNAGASAGDAAIQVGYKEYSVFYRNFKKRAGLAPTEYHHFK
ncbi:MAG: helix-turn-helix domain-containing protein [Clostridia bacterium]|nr:helix-turn-helix domain-containing protein [Clostridia bacterium]